MQHLFVYFLVLCKLFALVLAQSGQGDIIYPTADTVWHVGEQVNVTFKETVPPLETVAIFFDRDRENNLLAGGPLSRHVFKFTVPPGAVSPKNGRSLLLAVRRKNLYLSTVDAVNVRVEP